MGMRHISTSIAGLEALTDYRLKKMAPHFTVDGIPLRTATQVRRALKQARAEGLEFIPAAGCDNYDDKGLCKGHAGEEKTDEQINYGQSEKQY